MALKNAPDKKTNIEQTGEYHDSHILIVHGERRGMPREKREWRRSHKMSRGGSEGNVYVVLKVSQVNQGLNMINVHRKSMDN